MARRPLTRGAVLAGRLLGARLLVLAGLALAAVGLRSRDPLHTSTHHWSVHHLGQVVLLLGALTAVAVLVVVAVAGVAPVGGQSRRRQRAGLFRLLALLGGAVLLGGVVDRLRQHLLHLRAPRTTTDSGGPGVVQSATSSAHGGHGLTVVLVLLVAFALVGVAVVVLRRHRASVAPDLLDPADDDALALGVTAARRALAARADDPPRERVLAAYAAFEDALDDRGVTRLAADTASAVLARAVRSGADEAAAQRLTALFGRARYSTEQLDEADVDRAEQALVALLATA